MHGQNRLHPVNSMLSCLLSRRIASQHNGRRTVRRWGLGSAFLAVVTMIAMPGLAHAFCCCANVPAETAANSDTVLARNSHPSCCLPQQASGVASLAVTDGGDAACCEDDDLGELLHECDCRISSDEPLAYTNAVYSQRWDHDRELIPDFLSSCTDLGTLGHSVVALHAQGDSLTMLKAQDRCAQLCRWLK
jgi:hypothetical protein